MAGSVSAAQPFIAYDVRSGALGNEAVAGLGVANDFHVELPILVTQLGVFSSGTNGIQGGAVLTVQIYQRSGLSGKVLETISFDAVDPGRRVNGSLFKPLSVPLVLWPGDYSIAAYGFDASNPEGNGCQPPYDGQVEPWSMNDGGGLIQFAGSRFGYGGPNAFPTSVDAGQGSCYAAGTFVFTAATLAAVPYAADYAALTAGAGTVFQWMLANPTYTQEQSPSITTEVSHC